jgi:outer membrane biosynthesis protein TonB
VPQQIVAQGAAGAAAAGAAGHVEMAEADGVDGPGTPPAPPRQPTPTAKPTAKPAAERTAKPTAKRTRQLRNTAEARNAAATSSRPTPAAAKSSKPTPAAARISHPKISKPKPKPKPLPRAPRARPKAPQAEPGPYQSGYTFVTWRNGKWRALSLIRGSDDKDLLREWFKPAADTQEARAAAAELAARAVAAQLHDLGRGEQASFDKAGLPQQPRLIGVSEDTRQGVATGKWKAQIDKGDGRGTQHIGVFRTAKLAARAYDAHARLLNRPTNFKK